jgi:REP element-mobilizing transposase RayT
MARTGRQTSGTGIYHVSLRGINHQRIFEETEDYEKYLHCLGAVKKQSGFKLYAYCLMGNHIHMLLKEGDEPLSTTMKRLGVRYAYWFNAKYRRTGHLFQDRFKSEPIEDDVYFLTALRYIYQNPVAAGLCEKTDEYEWSSRRFSGKKNGLTDESDLKKIIPLPMIKEKAEELLDEASVSAKRGRRRRFSDQEAEAFMREICGASNAAAFQSLSAERQRRCIKRLWAKRVPIRQQARITGLGKGIVERWTAKGRGGTK